MIGLLSFPASFLSIEIWSEMEIWVEVDIVSQFWIVDNLVTSSSLKVPFVTGGSKIVLCLEVPSVVVAEVVGKNRSSLGGVFAHR